MNRRTKLSITVLLAGVISAGVVWMTDTGEPPPESTLAGDPPAVSVPSTASSSTTTPLSASAGAPGIGDALYPRLGNGGYDAQHHDLDVTFDPNDGILSGTSTMTAVAEQNLSVFNLDMAALLAPNVTVDGEPAMFHQESFELIIVPAAPIAEGEVFVVAAQYAGIPDRFATSALPARIGWFGGPKRCT